jgi:PAS domain S-box-containing protein
MKFLSNEPGIPDRIPLEAQQIIRHIRTEAMFVIDTKGCIASWNEGVGAMLGWNEDEWIGQPFQVSFTPEDVQAGVPQAEIVKAAATGRADDSRWMCRKNGERFFARGELTCLRDDRRRVVAYFKALHDATATERAEAELEKLLLINSQDRARAEQESTFWSASIETMTDGVIVADLRGVQHCNSAVLKLLGVSSINDLQVELSELLQRHMMKRRFQKHSSDKRTRSNFGSSDHSMAPTRTCDARPHQSGMTAGCWG